MKCPIGPINSIAIMRMSAIGDCILIVPLIRTLQERFPNAKITWITSPLIYELMQGLSGVEFLVLDKPNSLKSYLSCRKKLEYFHFDLLIAAQASLRVNLLYPFVKAKCKLGFKGFEARDGHGLFINQRVDTQPAHIVDNFLEFAKALGAKEFCRDWNLPIEEEDYAWAKQKIGNQSEKVIVINPCASNAEKTWSLKKYCELISAIKEKYACKIILTGGKNNTAFCEEIVSEVSADGIINLAGKSNLKQLAAIIDIADLVIAPDTGSMHLAVAVNTPVIALMAVTKPERSGPYLSSDLVVSKYPEDVEGRWGKVLHEKKLMDLITVDDVMEKLEFCQNSA